VIEPYQAIGLVPTMRGIRRRADIAVNLEHISHLIKAAYTHAEYRREVIDKQARLMHERDIWARPGDGSPQGGGSGAG
jgi:hypothetical protein